MHVSQKKMNPKAPHEILVGNKPRVIQSAKAFSKQLDPVPVFMKEAVNEWVYVGDFSVSRATFRNQGLERFNLGGRENIQIVLELDGGSKIHSSYSWQILPHNVAIKQADKSVFLHHGTGIPKDIRRFFSIESLQEGSKIAVTLVYARQKYSADFTVTNDRTRLLWRADFSQVIRSKFSAIYEGFSQDKIIETPLPQMRFKPDTNNDSAYFVEFLDATSIEQDIKSEIVEEYEPKHEGALKEYYGKRYERVPSNRRKAIEIHGTICAVCGFDFERAYGDRGRGFIEVHHTKPLSSLEDSYLPNPLTDLIPVCSNCHRMIHRRNDDILSIEELTALIKED